MLEYQLHNESTSLSLVFGELERHREALNIEEYSVSQTTLDQVIKIFLENTQIFFLTGFKKVTGMRVLPMRKVSCQHTT